MAGFVAENQQAGMVRIARWDECDTVENVQLVDVREAGEVAAMPVEGAVHIPLGQLRERAGELDASRPTLVFCAVGVRAYNGARTLAQHGFADVSVYPAGARFWKTTHMDIAARTKELAG